MPVEIMVLPRWFPFHIDKISYWARTVLVPLTVLNALKPKARNPKGVQIDELLRYAADICSPLAQGAASEISLVANFRRHRPRTETFRALLSEVVAPAVHRQG